MKKDNYSPEYKKCIDLRQRIKESEDVLSFTRKAPDILARLARGEKFPADSMQLAELFNLSLNKDGTPTAYTTGQLEGFIIDRKETVKGLKENKAELQKLVEKNNFPTQDSSDITADTEPMDMIDPDG